MGSTLFAIIFAAPACCTLPHGDVSFISKLSQKFLSDVPYALHM